MPSLHLFGRPCHLSSDALPLAGLVLVSVSAVLLSVCTAFVVRYSRPHTCEGSDARKQDALLYGMLALFCANILAGGAMVAVGLCGERLPEGLTGSLDLWNLSASLSIHAPRFSVQDPPWSRPAAGSCSPSCMPSLQSGWRWLASSPFASTQRTPSRLCAGPPSGAPLFVP